MNDRTQITPQQVKDQLNLIEAALTRARAEVAAMHPLLVRYARQAGVGFIGSRGATELMGDVSHALGQTWASVADLHQELASMAPGDFVQPFGADGK